MHKDVSLQLKGHWFEPSRQGTLYRHVLDLGRSRQELLVPLKSPPSLSLVTHVFSYLRIPPNRNLRTYGPKFHPCTLVSDMAFALFCLG